MISRLEMDQKNPQRARDELDRQVDVRSWRVPGATESQRSKVDSRTPVWWHGDEEASQTFLNAVGIVH